jgi:hypothetical protein
MGKGYAKTTALKEAVFLFVNFYVSQGYGGGSITRLHTGT